MSWFENREGSNQGDSNLGRKALVEAWPPLGQVHN